MRSFLIVAAVVAALGVAATPAGAVTLPGFRVEQIAMSSGFCSSLAIDSHGILYYTTTSGGVFRLEAGGVSTRIAQLHTEFVGNSGLLGMALLDDATAVVHYTSPGPAYEVISRIDLTSGAETIVAKVPDDTGAPGRAVPSEHHGGTPAIGDNGSVYVGIGDFGTFLIASKPDWYAGKILRIDTDGAVTILASGFRNPFGIAWDPAGKRLIVPDNGDVADDEINIVTAAGGFFGWPFTMGNFPPYPGAIPPVYTFPQVVAPTGLGSVSRNSYMRRGYVLNGFVTRAVYYIADVDAVPFPDPIALIEGETDPLIGIAVGPSGEICFASASSICRLVMPLRGDCNGDGIIDIRDLYALDRELADGDPHQATTAQDGSYRGSWGCDVNGDGVISSADRTALATLLRIRVRAVRGR